MFQPGAFHAYTSNYIDSPENGISLAKDVHGLFGKFLIYFELHDAQQHTYQVRRVDEGVLPTAPYPVMVTLRSVSGIEMPDEGLFAIHRACALIAYASRTGDAFNQIFQAMEDGMAMEADGITPIGYLVSYKLLFGHNNASGNSEPEASPPPRSNEEPS